MVFPVKGISGIKPAMVVRVEFPRLDPLGREQVGVHPALVFQSVEARFDFVYLAPFTSVRPEIDQSWKDKYPTIYPVFSAKSTCLPSDSILLLDQFRSVDASRITGRYGNLAREDFLRARDALVTVFGYTVNIPVEKSPAPVEDK